MYVHAMVQEHPNILLDLNMWQNIKDIIYVTQDKLILIL